MSRSSTEDATVQTAAVIRRLGLVERKDIFYCLLEPYKNHITKLFQSLSVVLFLTIAIFLEKFYCFHLFKS